MADVDRYRIAPDLSYSFDVDTFERGARNLDGATIDQLRSLAALYRGGEARWWASGWKSIAAGCAGCR